MDLLPTSVQQEIAASSAAFLADVLPLERRRTLAESDSGVDERVWSSAAELGWFGLGLPEELGGIGAGLADETLLLRELGRSLAPGPFVATLLSVRLAARAGLDDLAAALLAGVARAGRAVPAAGSVPAGETVNGELQLVDAGDAEWVLLIDSRGASLLPVAALTDVRPVPCIDPATRLARSVASGVEAVAHLPAEVEPLHRRALVLTAAQLVGMAEATRDISAEHAKSRVQFDRPIGVNQAVKHPCADMAIRSEAAWAQTIFAALAHDEGRADAEFHAVCALLVAADAAERNTTATVQILGGMGFTAEHAAHLFVKRTHVLQHLDGGSRVMLARLLELPPLTEPPPDFVSSGRGCGS